jgi:hypothetical protein
MAATRYNLTMNVTFRCPRCDQPSMAEFERGSAELTCCRCGVKLPVPAGSVTDQRVVQCLICPSTELFLRKDFPQTLGVAIVVLAAVVSSVFWYLHMPWWTYGTLFAAAFIDLVLYIVVGNQLQCYRCHAQYRGVPGLENHEPFDLETHEKYRQQVARLADASKERK